ncbi:hypothetical protein GCM10009102_04670 [Sphingomonas insulae]|uniref:Uncharacterized protein n=1 Tax=Sphingomonas insulae TaxID=424800 RepID=A0ABP3STJ3_9SPHN
MFVVSQAPRRDCVLSGYGTKPRLAASHATHRRGRAVLGPALIPKGEKGSVTANAPWWEWFAATPTEVVFLRRGADPGTAMPAVEDAACVESHESLIREKRPGPRRGVKERPCESVAAGPGTAARCRTGPPGAAVQRIVNMT